MSSVGKLTADVIAINFGSREPRLQSTLSGKGAAVFAEGLSGAVASGLGKVRYLN